jgi:hypothetical protein
MSFANERKKHEQVNCFSISTKIRKNWTIIINLFAKLVKFKTLDFFEIKDERQSKWKMGLHKRKHQRNKFKFPRMTYIGFWLYINLGIELGAT